MKENEGTTGKVSLYSGTVKTVNLHTPPLYMTPTIPIMPPVRTMNKVVACTPFPKQNIEKVIKGGIAMIDKKVNLQELTVVLASDTGFFPGQRVFVRGDQVVQNWVKEVFTVDGQEFILVPETAIMVVKNG
jgi:hypothetical protein